MGPAKDEILALSSQYGDLYNEIVRPERKYAISHYLRSRWAPLLGAARLWFVVALRQRCFWNDKQDWCVVDKKTLARESGLSLRTVNRIVAAADRPGGASQDRDALAAWFFSKTRRRRYDPQIGHRVNAPNRYHVLLDDPLTPQDQAALVRYIEGHLADRSAEGTLHLLESLCERPDVALYEIPCPLPDEGTTTAKRSVARAAFVIDVVEAHCPMPDHESPLYAQIARAASRLHNALTRPERVYVGNQYFRLQWVPELGPVLSALVVSLRARCYWNERTGELRDTCRVSWADLAREIGCTARQLRYLRGRPALSHFVTHVAEGHGRAKSQFQVRMYDPLTSADQTRFEKRAGASGGMQVDPETGQIDVYRLLAGTEAEDLAPGPALPAQGPSLLPPNAEFLARGPPEQTELLAPSASQEPETLAHGLPGQPEVLAPGERKIWHIDGLQAEILARQSGSSGTTIKIQVITPTVKGLAETALEVLDFAEKDTDPAAAAAALADHLLSHMDIQQPARSRLVSGRPHCAWIVAWGLYALSQPGLSANKAGYTVRRMSARDPPPQDMLALAALPPVAWRAFHTAHLRGLPSLVPPLYEEAFRCWRETLEPVWDDLEILLDVPEDAVDEEQEASDEGDLLVRVPPPLLELLTRECELAQGPEGRLKIVTRDLYRAYQLAREVRESELDAEVVVWYRDRMWREGGVNAELLALDIQPLAPQDWNSAQAELAMIMPSSVYNGRWRDVVPLGVIDGPGGAVCAVLCACTPEERDAVAEWETLRVERTLRGILGPQTTVRFESYAPPQAVPEALPP